MVCEKSLQLGDDRQCDRLRSRSAEVEADWRAQA
jgi:hypothetical protein